MGTHEFLNPFAESKGRTIFLLSLGSLALLACGNIPASAADGLRLGGFGTLGYAVDNRPDIAAAREISQRPANGFATGGSWRLDSRLGVQLEYAIGPNVDFVGQIVLRDQFKTDFNSSTELAYVAFKPRPQLDIRVGRINYDAFLMSDHRNVGYAYPWVRPPSEFYSWIPIFSLDGADAAYSIQHDDTRWRIKLQAGRSEMSIPIENGYDFNTNDLLGVSLSRQSEFWRLKAAYSQFTIGSEVPAFAPLHSALDQVAMAGIPSVSAEAGALRRNLTFKDAKIAYTTLGAAYDNGTWLAQGEIGHVTATADAVPHGRMGYLSVGRRFGAWTPYLMLSAARPANAVRTAASNWGALNAALRDPALFTVNTTRTEQNTLSIGTRWDFYSQAALKLQWDRTVIKPSGYGLWWRDLSINSQTSRVNQVSATLDFTF